MLELKNGDSIQDYTLIDFINSGTSADVWHVRDQMGQDKALKIFSPAKGVDGMTMDLLFEEFKLTLPLDHPNILKPEKIGVYKNVPYIAMPYCTGSLAEEITKRLIKRKRAGLDNINLFTELECAELLNAICQGLAYLHANDVIHQDVKPENILMLNTGTESRYVISDFGISQKLKANIIRQTIHVQPSSSQLTPAYAAPEQFKGWITNTSDVFALGVIAFEMVEGKLPFEPGKATGEYLSEGARMPQFASQISPAFRSLISRCVEVNARNRPDVSEIIDTTAKIMAGDLIESPEPVPQIREERRTELQENLPQAMQYDQTGAHVTMRSRQSDPVIHFDRQSNSEPYERKTIRSGRKSRSGLVVTLIGLAAVAGVAFWGYRNYSTINTTRAHQQALMSFQAGDLKNAKALWSTSAKRAKDSEQYRKVCDQVITNYEGLRPFQQHRAAVKGKDGWGFINTKGDLVIPCAYAEVMDFKSPATAVYQNNKCGLIDTSGNMLSGFEYVRCKYLGGNQWKVEKQEGAIRTESIINISAK